MNSPAACWAKLTQLADALPPAPSSEQWLLNMLERNASTETGRCFGFASLRSAAAFQRAVPPCDYAAIASRIERMADGEEDVLFSGRAAAFELTAGSTGLHGDAAAQTAKLVPYSRESLDDFRQAMLPWLASVIRQYAPAGRAYWCVSPAMRRPCATRGGIPVGVADGAYLGAEAVGPIVSLSVVPAWVTELEDPACWRLATLYHLVRAEDLSFLFLWSPTFFLTLLRHLREERDSLHTLLREGGTLAGRRLSPDRDAARRLARYLEHEDTRVLWPGPLLISAWADGWAAPFAEQLRALLPQAAFQPKGLLCTEGVVSIPGPDGRAHVAEGCGFLEFLAADGRARGGGELVPGESYSVLLTTSGGLYRYQCGDHVQCTGYAGERPVIRLLGREGICCDMVGEKLVDAFVAGCLEGIRGFALLQPQPDGRPAYRLLLDEREYGMREARLLARRLDAALGRNPQYAHARRLAQLGPVEALPLREPLEQYLAWAIAGGSGRQGIVKIPALCAARDFQPA